ncbi:tetratricopeptide repeat protein [Colwellia sp. MEBiC06753]
MDAVSKLIFYLSKDTSNYQLAISILNLCLEKHRFKLGLSVCSSLPSELKCKPEIIVASIQLFVGTNDFLQAKSLLTELKRHDSFYKQLSYLNILIHFLERDFLKCIYLYECSSITSHLNDTYLLISRTYFFERRYGEALKALDNLNDDLAEVNGLASLIYLDLGMDNKAEILSNKALKLSPNQIEALIVTANIAFNKGQFDVSKEIVGRASICANKEGRIYLIKAQLAMVEGDVKSAKHNIKIAISFMRDHIGSFHILGWCELLEQNIHDAKLAFENALLIDRNFADSHAALAIVQALFGDLQLAEKSNELALKLNPKSETAKFAQFFIIRLRMESKREKCADIAEQYKDTAEKVDIGFMAMLNAVKNYQVHS